MTTNYNGPPAADRLAQTVTEDEIARIRAYLLVVEANGELSITQDEIVRLCDTALLRARESAPAQEVDVSGKTWVLAPVGTSWDMRNEGRELLIDHDCKAARLDELADTIYRAMLNARPPFAVAPRAGE